MWTIKKSQLLHLKHLLRTQRAPAQSLNRVEHVRHIRGNRLPQVKQPYLHWVQENGSRSDFPLHLRERPPESVLCRRSVVTIYNLDVPVIRQMNKSRNMYFFCTFYLTYLEPVTAFIACTVELVGLFYSRSGGIWLHSITFVGSLTLRSSSQLLVLTICSSD